MSKKSEFQNQIESRLRLLDTRIKKFEGKVQEAGADAHAEYREILQDLRAWRSRAYSKLDALQTAGDDSRETLQSGMEDVWSGLKRATAKFVRLVRNGDTRLFPSKVDLNKPGVKRLNQLGDFAVIANKELHDSGMSHRFAVVNTSEKSVDSFHENHHKALSYTEALN